MSDKATPMKQTNRDHPVSISAGTRLSGDVLIYITAHPNRRVKIVSQVGDAVVDAIRKTVIRILDAGKYPNLYVRVFDNAAPNWVLEARMTTALRRWQATLSEGVHV